MVSSVEVSDSVEIFGVIVRHVQQNVEIRKVANKSACAEIDTGDFQSG